MNKAKDDLEPYQKIYTELGFERAGLFETIQKLYGSVTALYPGSSVHITPSFYLPHVMYVDRQAEAAEFFSRMDAIRAYVKRRKHYHRAAYLRFIAADYTQGLPLKEASFDLLIALFAGQAADACIKYLRLGGLVLTNANAEEVDRLCKQGCRLTATVSFRQGSYHVQPVEKNARAVPRKTTSPRYLRRDGDRLVYRENQIYQIFTRGQTGYNQVDSILQISEEADGS